MIAAAEQIQILGAYFRNSPWYREESTWRRESEPGGACRKRPHQEVVRGKRQLQAGHRGLVFQRGGVMIFSRGRIEETLALTIDSNDQLMTCKLYRFVRSRLGEKPAVPLSSGAAPRPYTSLSPSPGAPLPGPLYIAPSWAQEEVRAG